jgi:sodium-independent sulfate anion transporter 11
MAGATQDDKNKRELRERVVKEQDEERKGHNGAWRLQGEGRKISTDGRRPEITVTEKAKAYQPIYGVDRPFFHVDLVDAVDMAVRDATRKDEEERAQEARERHSEEHEVVGAAAVAVERPQ